LFQVGRQVNFHISAQQRAKPAEVNFNGFKFNGNAPERSEDFGLLLIKRIFQQFFIYPKPNPFRKPRFPFRCQPFIPFLWTFFA